MSDMPLLEGVRVDILLWMVAVAVIVFAVVTFWLQRREQRNLQWELPLGSELGKGSFLGVEMKVAD